VIPAALDEAAAALTSAGAQARNVEPLIEATGPGELRIGGRTLINMASNDYLGFAHDPRILTAARSALDRWGLGSAAGRVLSGTTTLHRELERRLATWVGCDDAVLHGSCWTANAAIFGTLSGLAREGGTTLAVLSDRLNHASIIDGIRAQRPTISHLGLYAHDDLDDLHSKLSQLPNDVAKVIVTDGVFSMEGDQAPLVALHRLAHEFRALLIVDDSHGTGVVGTTGRGTPEAQGVLGNIDIITGTLGKALGGAIGGFVAGPCQLIAALRATSRPYIFSNNPPTPVIAGALAALDILEGDDQPLTSLRARVEQLRTGITRLRLKTYPSQHPIVPVLLGDEARARQTSEALASAGVFATALSYPIVPRGEARLRLQVSAAHSHAAIDHVLGALERCA
jgi:glycine C-acetyltransferase